MDSFLPSSSNVLPSSTSKTQSGTNRRRRLKRALKRIQKRIIREESREKSPLARFRIQWVRSAFKMEKLPTVERKNIFEQFGNISLNKDMDPNTRVQTPERLEEPGKGLLCEEEMPTRLAEFFPSSDTLGIEIGEESNDSEICMEVSTSTSPPPVKDDFVELLSTIDNILQSDDDTFVI